MTRRQLFTAAIAFVASLVGWKVRPAAVPAVVKTNRDVVFKLTVANHDEMAERVAAAWRRVTEKLRARETEMQARIDELRSQIKAAAAKRRKPPDA